MFFNKRSPLSIKDRPIIDPRWDQPVPDLDKSDPDCRRMFARSEVYDMKLALIGKMAFNPDNYGRYMNFYFGDDQDGLEYNLIEIFDKSEGRYKYPNKVRKEALRNAKRRFRKWQRSQGGQRVTREYDKFKREYERGNFSYKYPEGIAQHYRFLSGYCK